MEFETVIGLEVHVQLSTQSKIFSSSSAAFGAEPNVHIDPVTLGLPGCLPVLNKKVVEYAIMLGLATNCEIRRFSRFARKHYFYPDLPKGYQISQYEEPICERGSIEIHDGEASRSIGITRIHMEEDAGKNIHDAKLRASLVDLNRAGVPLLEVVSEPDIRSPHEATAYLRALRQIVRYLGISDGNMEEGSLRCDANISLRPRGELKFGTRTEIKNLNSFRFVEKALEYEVARQLKILRSGRDVVQETRLFDSDSGSTHAMRSKEESADYRYMPDPDLPPLLIEESWIREVAARMPKLPETRFREFVEVCGLSPYDAGVLTAERETADYFEEAFRVSGNAKAACNWITTELFGRLNKESLSIVQAPVGAAALGRLIKLVDDGEINGKMAKSVFEEMFKTGSSPEDVIRRQGLRQITDEGEILALVREVFKQNRHQVQEYLQGNERVLGYLVGQVMKLTAGSANPKTVNATIRAELERIKEQD